MVCLVSRRWSGPASPTRRPREWVVLLADLRRWVVLLDDLRPVDALKDLFVHLMLLNNRQPADTPKVLFAHRLLVNHSVTLIFLPRYDRARTCRSTPRSNKRACAFSPWHCSWQLDGYPADQGCQFYPGSGTPAGTYAWPLASIDRSRYIGKTGEWQSIFGTLVECTCKTKALATSLNCSQWHILIAP